MASLSAGGNARQIDNGQSPRVILPLRAFQVREGPARLWALRWKICFARRSDVVLGTTAPHKYSFTPTPNLSSIV